jgi:hypothetical protein
MRTMVHAFHIRSQDSGNVISTCTELLEINRQWESQKQMELEEQQRKQAEAAQIPQPPQKVQSPPQRVNPSPLSSPQQPTSSPSQPQSSPTNSIPRIHERPKLIAKEPVQAPPTYQPQTSAYSIPEHIARLLEAQQYAVVFLKL